MSKKAKLVYFALILPILLVAATRAQSTANNQSRSELRRCLQSLSCSSDLDSAYQLARVGDFTYLLKVYASSSLMRRGTIIQGIYASDSGRANPQVSSVMKKIAFGQNAADSLSDTRWYALQFLAETCDERALAILNRHGGSPDASYSFQVSCGDWAKSLHAFGVCKYKQSRKVLINSLNSSCLDVLQSAGDSLGILFPGSCSVAKTPQEAAACYSAVPNVK